MRQGLVIARQPRPKQTRLILRGGFIRRLAKLAAATDGISWAAPSGPDTTITSERSHRAFQRFITVKAVAALFGEACRTSGRSGGRTVILHVLMPNYARGTAGFPHRGPESRPFATVPSTRGNGSIQGYARGPISAEPPSADGTKKMLPESSCP